jgi:hypothetical protein
MSARKQSRRERALARFPKFPSRKEKRTQAQYDAELARLTALVQSRGQQGKSYSLPQSQ